MRILTVLLLLSFTSIVQAGQAVIEAVRYWTAPDHIRVVLDTSGPVEHALFGLKNPERLVIDLKNVRLKAPLGKPGSGNKYLRGLRSGVRKDNDLRIVFDLKQGVKPKSFVLKPNKNYGHRLVFDLYDKATPVKRNTVVAKKRSVKKLRDIVIAVDAGHGGEDPGARGAKGTREKHVTLSIARKLAAAINRQPGMRAVMIRNGDYYIGLRKRMAIARKNRADLFVSIHADAFRDPRVKGSSVYTLSHSGASSEAARWLAEKENSADLVGGVSLDDKDDVLASVLLDLSQTATLEASGEAAQQVFGQLRRVGKVHGRRVQQAGFAVLKSPDIPSLLIETAFISNPEEERNLNDPVYQSKVAQSITRGVQQYFTSRPPMGTKMAAMRNPKKHAVSRGETLSGIAERYSVSTSEIKSNNALVNDRLKVGQVLEIPHTGG